MKKTPACRNCLKPNHEHALGDVCMKCVENWRWSPSRPRLAPAKRALKRVYSLVAAERILFESRAVSPSDREFIRKANMTPTKQAREARKRLEEKASAWIDAQDDFYASSDSYLAGLLEGLEMAAELVDDNHELKLGASIRQLKGEG